MCLNVIGLEPENQNSLQVFSHNGPEILAINVHSINSFEHTNDTLLRHDKHILMLDDSLNITVLHRYGKKNMKVV